MAKVTLEYLYQLRTKWDNLTGEFTAAYNKKALLGDDDSQKTLKDVKGLADFKRLKEDVKGTTDIARKKLDKGELINAKGSSGGDVEIKTMRAALNYLGGRVKPITVTHVYKTILVDKSPTKGGNAEWLDPSVRGKKASQYNFQIGITGVAASIVGVLVSVSAGFVALTARTSYNKASYAPLDVKENRLSAMKNTLKAIANEVYLSKTCMKVTKFSQSAAWMSVEKIKNGSGAQIGN